MVFYLYFFPFLVMKSLNATRWLSIVCQSQIGHWHHLPACICSSYFSCLFLFKKSALTQFVLCRSYFFLILFLWIKKKYAKQKYKHFVSSHWKAWTISKNTQKYLKKWIFRLFFFLKQTGIKKESKCAPWQRK